MTLLERLRGWAFGKKTAYYCDRCHLPIRGYVNWNGLNKYCDACNETLVKF